MCLGCICAKHIYMSGDKQQRDIMGRIKGDMLSSLECGTLVALLVDRMA